MVSSRCPCHSEKSYEECCQLYHNGKLPESALSLMRSRYAAYALGLADYIISTTDPDHRDYSSNLISWKQQILMFSSMTTFQGL